MLAFGYLILCSIDYPCGVDIESVFRSLIVKEAVATYKPSGNSQRTQVREYAQYLRERWIGTEVSTRIQCEKRIVLRAFIFDGEYSTFVFPLPEIPSDEC